MKLSGGLDSACVAAGLAANGLADGHALALAGTFATEPITDESELIEATARHTRLPLERIAFDPTDSMLAPALAHIEHWRLPPATPNLFLWQPLMARARELGVDLMLDGEGGDELFGLAAYLIADMLRAGRPYKAWSLTARIPGIGLNPDRSIRIRVLRYYGLRPLVPSAVQRYREARRRTRSSGSIVPPADARALAELLAVSEEDRPAGTVVVAVSGGEPDRRARPARRRRSFSPRGRRRADRRRHPFLYDLRLTEAALRLPPQVQFDPDPRPPAAARCAYRPDPGGGTHTSREEPLHTRGARGHARRRSRPDRAAAASRRPASRLRRGRSTRAKNRGGPGSALDARRGPPVAGRDRQQVAALPDGPRLIVGSSWPISGPITRSVLFQALCGARRRP